MRARRPDALRQFGPLHRHRSDKSGDKNGEAANEKAAGTDNVVAALMAKRLAGLGSKDNSTGFSL